MPPQKKLQMLQVRRAQLFPQYEGAAESGNGPLQKMAQRVRAYA